MATRVEIRTVSCLVSTPQSAAVETDLSFTPGRVELIEVRIPPGHAFLTGIAIAQAHQVMIPASGSAWLIGDDERLAFPTEQYGESGSWSAFTFNTDTIYSHLWQLRFHVVDTPLPKRRLARRRLDAHEIHAHARMV